MKMTSRANLLKILPAWVWVWLLLCVATESRAWDYGNGRHGSYVLTTNATIEQLYQTVRLTNDPAQYDPNDSNAIPNFQNLIITNGATLYANAWDGTSGGQIVLKVQATLAIANGSTISVSGLGYRGGVVSDNSGIQGESYTGTPAASPSANYGGGGAGGKFDLINGNWIYNNAGGGGYGQPGESSPGTVTGFGGNTYGTPSIDILYMGSGGGGGGYSGSCWTNGGNGGGAIEIHAGNLLLSGSVQANGATGGQGSCGYITSGGGSGGSIKLQTATANIGTNQLAVNGGSGSASGGVGRIAIYYAESYSGTSSPAAYMLQDTNSDNVTVITNQPASQISFLESNVVFTVSANGFSPFFYQWYFNTNPIPSATNQTLSLFDLDFTNSGDYSVCISNVVGTVISSNAYLTVLDPRDPFDGGIPNWWKSQYGLSLTDPTLATNYPPADSQLTYLQKYLYDLNPLTNDTDGDGISDYDELFTYHSNPTNTFTAGDGIPDGWKETNGLNLSIVYSNKEAGFNGVTYAQIYQYDLTHTNQLNPNTPFAVGSGLSSYELINNGAHTNKFYYDHEDRLLGMESSRGTSIGYQYDGNGNLIHQAVLSRADETNGLPVLWLWLNGLTNQPGIAYTDSDGDGWTDYQEWLAGSNPTNASSTPNLLGNPGVNIASLTLPFTPSNFVVGVGNLDGLPGDEIVVGADGNPGTNNNSLFVLTQTATNWSTQQINVGSFGITSIAIGQPTNRPSAGIYVGLRGTNGNGQVMEFTSNGGIWQSNLIALSTNPVAFVVGVRSNNDLLASLSPTNDLDGALWSLTSTNSGWNKRLVSTNTSHGIGSMAQLFAQTIYRPVAIRQLDSGGIEIFNCGLQLVSNGSLIPTNSPYNPATDKWYFTTPSNTVYYYVANYCHQLGGNVVTISSDAENQWVQAHYPSKYFLGLFTGQTGSGQGGQGMVDPVNGWGWDSGSFSTYRNWESGQPYFWGNISMQTAAAKDTAGQWYMTDGAYGPGGPIPGIGELRGWDWETVLQNMSGFRPINWPESMLQGGFLTSNSSNSLYLYYTFVDDKNSSRRIDQGDNLVFAEYNLQTTNWTTNIFASVPITSANPAQTYGIALVNFILDQPDYLFSAEPDGQIFYWTTTNGITALQHQLFSSDYAGKAWHALSAVNMAAGGQGLIGLMVDPTNQNTCNVIFWPPESTLSSPQTGVVETAPSAAVLPSANSLGSNAVVTVRLWDNEGDASTPFLQYQFLGATNWQNATLTALDGSPYNSATRITALPNGSSHTLTWNAISDVGANVVTNILLRARAQDFMLVGDWSQPTPFQLDTTMATSLPPPTKLASQFHRHCADSRWNTI